MPSPVRTLRCPDRAEFTAGFERIRRRLEVPDDFPAEVLAAAASVEAPDESTRVDRRDLDLVTIDPPGSRDLDQAYHAVETADGFRVHYAIADVAAFVTPGDALDVEARARVVTLYSPDARAALHPEAVSEGAASLLPAVDRPAVLWTVDLDGAGAVRDVAVERAMVRSREQLTYAESQRRVDAGEAEGALGVLPAVGAARLARQADRGGVSLHLPDQEVVESEDGYALVYERSVDVERWNEQLSLLTGMVAADLMLDTGVGIVRTLPPPSPDTVAELGRAATALGVPWAEVAIDYAGVLADLDSSIPAHAALVTQAARLFRGAGYESFTDGPPDHAEHSAIASPYAHVTAPLRRLVDRFAAEVALAASADARPPGWAVDALEELPSLMGRGKQRQSALDRETVDFVEAMVLRDRLGETFAAVVTAVDDGSARIQLREPAVLTRMSDDSVAPGTEIDVRLDRVDPEAGRVDFAVV